MGRVLVLSLLGCSCLMSSIIVWRMWRGPTPEPPPLQSQPRRVAAFDLTCRTGQAFDSARLDGRIWVASFFFTTCTETCRAQNELMADLHREFAEAGVHFVAISCDPRTDTPERLATYAREFTDDQQRWLFLTGSLKEISRLGVESFGLPIAQRTHANRLVVVDGRGVIRGTYTWTEPQQVRALRSLLGQLASGE